MLRINEQEFQSLLAEGATYDELVAAPTPPVSPYAELAETLKASVAELVALQTAPIEIPGLSQLVVDLQAMTLALNRPTPIPVVQVAAPNVEIKPPSPSPRIWESRVTGRDAQGRIEVIIHTAVD